jgi:glycosyltransferase involved in cell wall biosynthesis
VRGLLVTNDFPPMVGGLATWYGRMCAVLPPEQVLVLAPRTPGAEAWDRTVPYRVVRSRAPTTPAPASRMLQVVLLTSAAAWISHNNSVGVVHIGHLHLGVVGLVLRRCLGLPYVLYLHGGEMARYLRRAAVRKLFRRVVGEASLVVVNSPFTQTHFSSLGLSNPRTRVLAMSAPVDHFRPDADPTPARRHYGLDGGPVLLTVGRLVERKGHDVAIRAVALLKERYPGIRYVIAGTGPREPVLRALASAAGCAEAVVFAGHVPDALLPALYAACDVFIMPCKALDRRDGVEGLGLVFLEAAACGRPVVGGRSGGTEEAVEDGVTGILVDPARVDEVVGAVDRLLSDPDLAARLGRAGRARAEAREAQWRGVVRRLWTLDQEA